RVDDCLSRAELSRGDSRLNHVQGWVILDRTVWVTLFGLGKELNAGKFGSYLRYAEKWRVSNAFEHRLPDGLTGDRKLELRRWTFRCSYLLVKPETQAAFICDRFTPNWMQQPISSVFRDSLPRNRGFRSRVLCGCQVRLPFTERLTFF